MKTSILSLSIIAILCAACKNELTPNFDDMDGVLVINAFLHTDRDTNYVYVSETSQSTPPPVNNATVEMRINGTLVESVSTVTPTIKTIVNYTDTTVTKTDQGVYQLTKRFSEGDVVRIDVYSNGRHAWAEETAPRRIQNPTAAFKLANHAVSTYGEPTTITCADFIINLPDISQDPEYYRISAYADYACSTTRWEKHGTYYANYENTDSICDELRKKYRMVLPIEFVDDYGDKEVDIYYLYLDDSDRWNYGANRDFDYGNDPILSEGEMSKSVNDDSDQEMLLTSITNKHKVFTDHFFSNSTAEIHISLDLPFGDLYLPESVYSSHSLSRLPESYLLMSGMTMDTKIKLSIESISENQYYYLKALNVVQSENYEDMSQLSGALKIPSNVVGGSGNICVTTSNVLEFTVLDNYSRKRVVEEEPIFY